MKNYIYLALFLLTLCVPAIAGTINSYTLKSPPDDADMIPIYDSDDGSTKKIQVGDISGSSSGSGINWSAYPDLTSLTNAQELLINNSGTSSSVNWEVVKENITSGVNWFNIDSLRNGYNVKAFGAVGDGTTNDTTAIQDAINAAHANTTGGLVYFPTGTYSITDLTYYTNVSLKGDSREASILKARTGTTNMLYYTNLSSDTFAPFYTYIRDLQFDGNSVVSVTGIRLLNSPFFTIEDVRVHHCDIGLYATGNYLANITGSRFTFNRIGLYFGRAALPTTANLPNEITISHSSITANTEWGLEADKISSLILTSIDVEQNGTSADLTTGGIMMTNLTDDPTSGGVGLIVKDGWFEANRGQADIQIGTASTNPVSLIVDSTNFADYTVSGSRSQYYIYSPDSSGTVLVSNSTFNGTIDNYVVGSYKTINVNTPNTNNAYRPEIAFAIGAHQGYLSEIGSTKHMYLINTSSSSSTGGGSIALGATDGSALANGDRTGAINFVGSTATGKMEFGSRIEAFVDGSVGDGDLPMGLSIDVIPDGTITRTRALTIKNNGNVGIGTINPTQKFQVGTASAGFQATTTGGLISAGNVGISTTAPSNGCKCAVYTNGLCTTTGACD